MMILYILYIGLKVHRLTTNLVFLGPHSATMPCATETHLLEPVQAAIFLDYSPTMSEQIGLTILTSRRVRTVDIRWMFVADISEPVSLN